ncbi:MAG: serine/threonine protein kinase [Gemmataceae bacterium]
MNPRLDESTTADESLMSQAVQEYLRELEQGRRPTHQAFAARYPQLAREIRPFLEALDLMQAGATHLPKSHPSKGPLDECEPMLPLGDFRIIRELGRGGMGIVYEAIQLSLGRRVALKVLPFAAALDSRQLQRFKNEAQAAAQLHHSNIVPVYFVGSERGVHFYAMQLIEGQNLSALIETIRWGPSAPDVAGTGKDQTPVASESTDVVSGPTPLASQMSTMHSGKPGEFHRTVVRLIVQAAEALDYAHNLGIVHRDVKPANILVDSRSHVWVTDFGLAQFHANPALTQSGDLIGTLRYMSPEQASGRQLLADPRTDVYSLGATLYEMLTLSPLFEGNDRQTLLQQILQEEPRPARQRDPSISPELETIVIKSLSKNPSERYASAAEMADDLNRFLRHEPIRARRDTPLQRMRKWFRRHPSVLTGGAILLVLATIGSLAATALIRLEQGRTREAYEKERLRAEEADRQFRLARRSVDQMIQLAEEEMTDQPPLQDLRKRMLETALSYYQEFIELRGEDPETQAELAGTHARVKQILADLAVLQGAGQFALLGRPEVLEDLKATPEQRERMEKWPTRMEEQRHRMFESFHRLSTEERQSRFLELARENESEVASILKPEQLQRLKQIALQLQGVFAFRKQEVVTALKLTAEQRERIRGVEGEVFSMADRFRKGPRGPQPRDGEMRERPRKGPEGEGDPPGPPDWPGRPPLRPGAPVGKMKGPGMGPGPGGPLGEGRRPFLFPVQRLAVEKIVEILTPEQRQTWNDLTGKPFQGGRPAFLPDGPERFPRPR